MHAGGAGFDVGLHDLESIQNTAKPGFGIGHDGGEPVDIAFAFHGLDLIGAL